MAVNPKIVFSRWSSEAIVAALDGFEYLHDWRQDYRVRSVLSSLQSTKIMCFDAAILGYGLLDLFPDVARKILAIHRRSPDGEECGHVVVVYRNPTTGHYGALARSNYPGLEHRSPAFPSAQAVALTYARAYVKMGFTPLYFGFSDLDEISGDLDWRRAPGDLNVLSERLSQSYQYEFDLRDRPADPPSTSRRETTHPEAHSHSPDLP